MIKLIIKQGPFYISSFTALFLALAQTGWLDRMFPMTEISSPLPEPMIGSAVECNADGQCTESFMFGDLDFVPEQGAIPEWLVLLVFISGGLLLGFLLSRLWKRFI